MSGENNITALLSIRLHWSRWSPGVQHSMSPFLGTDVTSVNINGDCLAKFASFENDRYTHTCCGLPLSLSRILLQTQGSALSIVLPGYLVAHENRFAMHKALNIKQRIIRGTDLIKAPLATFDTIDLGDGDTQLTIENKSREDNSKDISKEKPHNQKKFVCQAPSKPETIGGNNSKKSLSQAGGGKDEKKDVEAPNIAGDSKQNPDETGTITSSKPTQPSSSLSPQTDAQEEREVTLASANLNPEAVADKDIKEEVSEPSRPSAVKDSPVCPSAGLTRQGTLGRVSIPIRKQDSISSSSSSETCNDTYFTFTATRPSIAHLDSADAGPNLPDSARDKDTVSSLIPDNIDPSQILSPSKRKAYEKRIERLKVTTSPIARPRSTAPISVVTLDEYANLSSPEASPASPCVLQDKLKITLPSDEFAAKPKTPKNLSAKKQDSEDTCFEFTEEILFRCTKSALVVEEDGHLPLSPRRVLIPPTITPATSPKLSSSPRLGKDGGAEDISTSVTPKLIYFKEDVNAQTFFGKTVDQTENENWADFTDSRINFEKADSEISEKEVKKSSSQLSKDLSLSDQVPADGGFYFPENEDTNGSQHNQSTCCTDINVSPKNLKSSSASTSPANVSDIQAATDISQSNLNIQTTYNIKEHSEDVLVLEIIQHEQGSEKKIEVDVKEQDSKDEVDVKEQDSKDEVDVKEQNSKDEVDVKEQDSKDEVDVKEQDSKDELSVENDKTCHAHSPSDEGKWALFDTVSAPCEYDVSNFSKGFSENGNLPCQTTISGLDLKDTTAETQPFPDATSLLDSSAASFGDNSGETSPWCMTPLNTSTVNSCPSPNQVTHSFNEGLLLIDSSPLDQELLLAGRSQFDEGFDALDSGQVTLTPFPEPLSPSPTDLISFSSSQEAEDTLEGQ